MKCPICKCSKFSIDIIPDCGDCEHNGGYDDELGYIYDNLQLKEKGIERNQVENEGECKYDSAWGDGCYMFTCIDCGWTKNLALMSE